MQTPQCRCLTIVWSTEKLNTKNLCKCNVYCKQRQIASPWYTVPKLNGEKCPMSTQLRQATSQLRTWESKINIFRKKLYADMLNHKSTVNNG